MRIAVFGAGYGGLALARDLEDRLPPGDDLVVVDEQPTHLVQHLLHRVVRRPELAEDLRIPLAEVLDRATVRQARVEAVDPDAGVATLADGTLEYDVGAVALGARTDFHGLPGVEAHATPLKRLSHAEQIRADALGLLETGGGKVVVAGAGLSGVQVAGELVALAEDEDASDALDVYLIEQADQVAPTFPDRFRRAIETELRERGVMVETDREVARATDEGVTLSDGSEVPADQLVWTGGITGPAALGDDRPTVRARLRLGERTFGLGDAVSVIDADGVAVPASAQTAIEQAAVAAENVAALADHRRDGGGGFEPQLATYRHEASGWLVTVGDGAVAMVGPTVLTGRAAKAMKAGVGAQYFRSLGVGPAFRERLRRALRGRG